MFGFGKRKVVVKAYAPGHRWMPSLVPGQRVSDSFWSDAEKMARQGYAVAIQSQNAWTGELTASYRLVRGN